MGMYDNVSFDDVPAEQRPKCPKCKSVLFGFQSKSGPCGLYNLQYWEVDNFYTFCETCGSHIEFSLKRKKEKIPLSDYTVSVTGISRGRRKGKA